MNTEPSIDDAGALKISIRREAQARRAEQPDQEDVSRRVCQRLAALPEYHAARTVMAYVGVCDEVRTQPLLLGSLALGKKLVVPYCLKGELELFRLEELEELAVGHFGIPEPRPELRKEFGKRVDPAELDLVIVPGVAFDRRGGRLGHGKGYYDRLLARVRPDAVLAAAAFECQLFPEIPMLSYDVFMDKVVTEAAIYEGRGR